MTDFDDPMIAFEQTRAAELAEFYRGLALLSEVTTLDDLRAHESSLRMRLMEMLPELISGPEAQAFQYHLNAMLHSCACALGEGTRAYPNPKDLIQVEQDAPQLLLQVRSKIELGAETIRRSYLKEEWHGVGDRTWEVASFSGYLLGLHEHKLLSTDQLHVLSKEWDLARAAAAEAV
ncbi:hypothetical protein [Pseudomonas parafulva]|uniref:hypothetical protein n=1 Tax=Pseudomonas parafulva TaxID=157782 RepID=UPI000734F93B|nr:hypothetical protein [Pseudomonas parafulva]